MYLLIFVRLQAERGISFVKGSLAFMTGVHSKVATIMKETELGTRCGRRTMYVSCRFIASGSIRVMRYNNNNNYYVIVDRKSNKNNSNSQFGLAQSTVDGVSDLEIIEVGRRSGWFE